MSSLKYAAVVAAGAAIGAFIAIAVVMPQAASAAASASKLILTQWLGLGTSTPSQRLSVAGSAYITGDVITGSGIRFSDGTTQTTAATGGSSGISGYERVTNSYGGFVITWSASCSSGKKLLGGGCGGSNGGYTCYSESSGYSGVLGYPSSDTTFTCTCTDPGPTSVYRPTAYAICATAQ